MFEATRPPGDEEVAFHWLDFTKILLRLSGHFTAGATSAIAELIDLGQWFAGASDTGAPTYDTVSIKAHELGAEVEGQASRINAELESLGDIIVSDPVKLAYFAKAGCAPDPGCPQALQSDPTRRRRARRPTKIAGTDAIVEDTIETYTTSNESACKVTGTSNYACTPQGLKLTFKNS